MNENKANLDIGYLLSKSFDLLKKQTNNVFTMVAVYIGVAILVGTINATLFKNIKIMNFILNIGIMGPLFAGLMFTIIKIVRNKSVEIPMLLDGYKKYWESVGTYFGMFTGITFGIILFIVPGVFIMVRFFVVMFLVMDEEGNILDNFKRSFELTAGKFWEIFLISLVILFINIGGALCFLVGLAFTIPLTIIMQAYVYEELKKDVKAIPLQ